MEAISQTIQLCVEQLNLKVKGETCSKRPVQVLLFLKYLIAKDCCHFGNVNTFSYVLYNTLWNHILRSFQKVPSNKPHEG